MSLKLLGVKNAATPNDESVVLKATAKVNLKNYAIVDKTFTEAKKVSNQFRHIFFFPDLVVEEGEGIILSTGEGTYRRIEQEGDVVHLFFWQSNECIWNDEGGDRAWLIKYDVLENILVPAVEEK